MTRDNLIAYGNAYPLLKENVFIAPGAWIIGDVVIGEESSIWFNTVVRGDEHYIRIGSRTNVQDNSTLHVTGGRFPLIIGDRITIGHRAIVHGCVVEDDCLIGMGSIIMDGARIGRGSLVAAGSVVIPGTIVPPGSVVMGMPAQVKKPVGETETRMIRDAVSNYLRLAENHSVPADQKKVKGFLG
jgi:carbonic anhydrase/acetyltransferase-like protein (isoleucine patch superfamily)